MGGPDGICSPKGNGVGWPQVVGVSEALLVGCEWARWEWGGVYQVRQESH